jgi:hypothetical protein
MGEGGEAHKVTLTKPFYLGVYEVTQQQYEKVMGKNPTRFKGAKNPVDSMTWTEAVEFCRRLSVLPEEKAAGHVYRLPTEAEWEYSCRAGTTTKYSLGDSDSQLGEYAWFEKNSGDTTHPVGQKKVNPWGLCDMHGNVWEWCQDRYGSYPSGSVTDPQGPKSGSRRLLRGGAFNYQPSDVRSAVRDNALPGGRATVYGFRVARTHPLSLELRKRGKLSISLLSDFDKTAKVIMGEWKVAGGSLTGAGASGHDQCKIELGNIPFKEYDFTTTFVIKRRSTDGFGDLFMRLPYLKQHLLFRTTKGTVGKTHIGFNISSQYVDPKSSATFPDRLTLGKPYHLLVRVREGSNVQILLDGKQIVVTKVAAQERPNMSISMTGVVAFKSLNFVAVH